MINDLINQMVEAGVHLGHQTRKWHPSMKKYLLKDKAGIHIINLEETEKCLDKACSFLADLARRNKKILFVGCKRQAQEAVREAAEATGQYYVNHRWLGGMLTNMSTIRKSIERLVYLEGIEKSPEFKSMSKKELAALDANARSWNATFRASATWAALRTPWWPSAPTMKTSPSARPTA